MNCSENPVEGAGVTGTSRSLVRRRYSVTSMVARPLSKLASTPASISNVRSGLMVAVPATGPIVVHAPPPMTQPPCSEVNFCPNNGWLPVSP